MTEKELLLRAFPAVPRDYHDGLVNTLSRLNKTRARRKKTLLIAALIGALLIAGCAIAIKNGGVLDYLFYRKTPPKEAVELVQTVDESETGAGVTVTVDEYAYDGTTVAVSYTLSNGTNDTLLVFNDGGRDFGEIRGESGKLFWGGLGWGEGVELAALGGSVEGVKLENSLNCGQQTSVSPEAQTLTLTVHANVYRPLVPLALSDKTAGEGEALVIEHGGYSWDSAKNDAAVDAWYKKAGHGGDDLAQALVGMGWIEKIGEVSFKKTLEPSASASNVVTLKEPIELKVGDDIITLERVNFSPLTTEYRMSVGSKPGAKDGFERWWQGALLDARGEPFQLSGGARERIKPDGTKATYIDRYGRPLTSMPTSFVLCPLKEDGSREGGRNNIDTYDFDNAIRLKIENGVIVAPEKPNDRKVVYAADFAADEAGTGEILSAKPMTWTKKALSRAFAGGKKLSPHKDDPTCYVRKDGTRVNVGMTPGSLFYHSGALAEEFVSVFLVNNNARNNARGEINGFPFERALNILDETLSTLGLSRGRTAYLSAWDEAALSKLYANGEVSEENNLPGDAVNLKTPKGGYFMTFALNYNGLDCLMEERPVYGYAERLPAGSSLTAFVNPDGVLYVDTLDYSAVYETSGMGKSITPITFDAAKSAAETYLSRGEADATVEIKRAYYEYMPVWAGENKSELTLRPIWSFYAERKDKALYPLVYVDAEDGEIRY